MNQLLSNFLRVTPSYRGRAPNQRRGGQARTYSDYAGTPNSQFMSKDTTASSPPLQTDQIGHVATHIHEEEADIINLVREANEANIAPVVPLTNVSKNTSESKPTVATTPSFGTQIPSNYFNNNGAPLPPPPNISTNYNSTTPATNYSLNGSDNSANVVVQPPMAPRGERKSMKTPSPTDSLGTLRSFQSANSASLIYKSCESSNSVELIHQKDSLNNKNSSAVEDSAKAKNNYIKQFNFFTNSLSSSSTASGGPVKSPNNSIVQPATFTHHAKGKSSSPLSEGRPNNNVDLTNIKEESSYTSTPELRRMNAAAKNGNNTNNNYVDLKKLSLTGAATNGGMSKNNGNETLGLAATAKRTAVAASSNNHFHQSTNGTTSSSTRGSLPGAPTRFKYGSTNLPANIYDESRFGPTSFDPPSRNGSKNLNNPSYGGGTSSYNNITHPVRYSPTSSNNGARSNYSNHSHGSGKHSNNSSKHSSNVSRHSGGDPYLKEFLESDSEKLSNSGLNWASPQVYSPETGMFQQQNLNEGGGNRFDSGFIISSHSKESAGGSNRSWNRVEQDILSRTKGGSHQNVGGGHGTSGSSSSEIDLS